MTWVAAVVCVAVVTINVIVVRHPFSRTVLELELEVETVWRHIVNAFKLWSVLSVL